MLLQAHPAIGQFLVALVRFAIGAVIAFNTSALVPIRTGWLSAGFLLLALLWWLILSGGAVSEGEQFLFVLPCCKTLPLIIGPFAFFCSAILAALV